MQDDRKSHWEQVNRDKSPLEVSWYQAALLKTRIEMHRTPSGKHQLFNYFRWVRRVRA